MSVLVFTDRHVSEAAGRPLAVTVQLAAAAGATAVVLREKDLGADARFRLATQVRVAMDDTPAHLMIASDAQLAAAVGAAGVHLAAVDPLPPGQVGVLGRSCHNLDEGTAAGPVDYVTLSPFAPSASKPGYGPALGPEGFARIANDIDVPVIALGGINNANARVAVAAGAAGVAVMGAVMGADDPARIVQQLVDITAAARSGDAS